jgi:hypothetical protein
MKGLWGIPPKYRKKIAKYTLSLFHMKGLWGIFPKLKKKIAKYTPKY